MFYLAKQLILTHLLKLPLQVKSVGFKLRQLDRTFQSFMHGS